MVTQPSYRGFFPASPTLLSDSHITPQHWQLRDLLHIDGTSQSYRDAYDKAHDLGRLGESSHLKLRKRDTPQSTYFVRGQDVYCTEPHRDVLDHHARTRERRTIQGDFMVHSIGVGHGFIATGGGFGELTVLDQATGALSTSCLPGSINNALSIASHDALPDSHPSKTRLYVSNNDSTIKVLALSTLRNETKLNYYDDYGTGSRMRMQTPVNSVQPPRILAEVKCPAAVNYAALSPDGKMLAAVDDRNELLLWDIIQGNGSEDEFRFRGSWRTSQDAGFGCDWDPSSQKVAVASQDGFVTVFDVRQLPAQANTSDMSNINARDCRIPSFVSTSLSTRRRGAGGAGRTSSTTMTSGAWSEEEVKATLVESHRDHFAQFKMINAKSSKGAARIVKFSRGPSNLLAFAEHRAHAHVVDTTDWQTIQHIRVPQALRWPARREEARGGLADTRRVQFTAVESLSGTHSRTSTGNSTLSTSTSTTSIAEDVEECYGTVEEAVRAANLSMQHREREAELEGHGDDDGDGDVDEDVLMESQDLLAQRIRHLAEGGEAILGAPPTLHRRRNRTSQAGLTSQMEDILRRISRANEASEERASALSELMEIIGDVESATNGGGGGGGGGAHPADRASMVDVLTASPSARRFVQQGNFVHVASRDAAAAASGPMSPSSRTTSSTTVFSPSRLPRARTSGRQDFGSRGGSSLAVTTGVSPFIASSMPQLQQHQALAPISGRRPVATSAQAQALYLNPTASTPHPDDILGLAWSLTGEQLVMAVGSDLPCRHREAAAAVAGADPTTTGGAGGGRWSHEGNAGIWVWDVDSRSRRMPGVLQMR